MSSASDATHPISVRGLRKVYGDRTVLHGVDLDVERGTCLALLGPNGAGKTTTVEILEAYRSRDGGAVSVLGVDPAAATNAWRARIGIVLQSASDNADLSVRETLHAFAGLYPNPRPVDELIELVGLTSQHAVRTRALSGGQRRRLDVALGIVGRPELLFLDEPTTGFDPEARRAFWDLIEMLRSEGTTIVLTTHYLDEAEHLADHVAVLVGGSVRATGTPATLAGRDQSIATVRWTDALGAAHTETTREPGALVASLFADGGEPVGLEVTRPTLEDVYLSLLETEGGSW